MQERFGELGVFRVLTGERDILVSYGVSQNEARIVVECRDETATGNENENMAFELFRPLANHSLELVSHSVD